MASGTEERASLAFFVLESEPVDPRLYKVGVRIYNVDTHARAMASLLPLQRAAVVGPARRGGLIPTRKQETVFP